MVINKKFIFELKYFVFFLNLVITNIFPRIKLVLLNLRKKKKKGCWLCLIRNVNMIKNAPHCTNNAQPIMECKNNAITYSTFEGTCGDLIGQSIFPPTIPNHSTKLLI